MRFEVKRASDVNLSEVIECPCEGAIYDELTKGYYIEINSIAELLVLGHKTGSALIIYPGVIYSKDGAVYTRDNAITIYDDYIE